MSTCPLFPHVTRRGWKNFIDGWIDIVLCFSHSPFFPLSPPSSLLLTFHFFVCFSDFLFLLMMEALCDSFIKAV